MRPEPLYRLKRLAKELTRNRKAVLKGVDPGALHDLRVTLRRLSTGLRLFNDGRRASSILRNEIKHLARDTNRIRDQEVLCALLRSTASLASSPLERWIRAQEDVLKALQKELKDRLETPSFLIWVDRLPSRLDAIPCRPKTARRHYQKDYHELSRLLERSLRSRPSTRLLHHLRIKAKRVRYALEDFKFLGLPQPDHLTGVCHEIQDLLGQWRDLKNMGEKLKAAGRSRFPGIQPWFQEINRQTDALWKNYLKKAHRLHRKM